VFVFVPIRIVCHIRSIGALNTAPTGQLCVYAEMLWLSPLLT